MARIMFATAAALAFSLSVSAAEPITSPEAAASQKPAAAPALTLEEAVRLALHSDDPYLLEPGERASALDDQATAAAQLPDPKLKVGLANWPTDSFSYTQEPMTQIQVGLSQAFPKGKTLDYKRQKMTAMAEGERFMTALRQREVVLDTRANWLDLYYWVHAAQEVRKSRQAVKELIEVVRAVYATGRSNSQDILRAELELSLLDDKLVAIGRGEAMARARLSRRIGTAAAARTVSPSWPAMTHPDARDVIAKLLPQHPAVRILAAKTDAAARDVDIAHEQYKPGWAVNVGYGARGSDRADFASVGVTMDLPIFTGKRQDKMAAAAKKARQAATLSEDATLRDLREKLDTAYADWQETGKRITLYKSAVIKRAKDTAEASVLSYRSGVTDFPELIRTRLAELNTELTLLKLETDRYKAQARLLFLEGENNE
ncbi:TolC family protein [Kordiimonas marina]|uniref:TolC family protein n=1 Tax=Kordiimonas marina TaxID=2872312 RepID=UPI001FF0ECA6|nr:TolC family protein [Kordiimonas marina]MCJ9430062.1 TolC family protein [Kordiimonas marina]